tara:strand:- start:11598 stop:12182 length:585 start_codon:yes stop_codon:yes gene_type:complete
MSGAFDLAWSVLKALPEQQAFAQQVVPPEQFGQRPATPQMRLGTVPPPILGAMRRKQGEYIMGDEREGVEHFERHPEYLGMGIEKPFSVPEQPARREGQLTQVPTTLNQLRSGPLFGDSPYVGEQDYGDATKHVGYQKVLGDKEQALRGSVFSPPPGSVRYSARDSFREVPPADRQYYNLDPNAVAAYLQSIGF